MARTRKGRKQAGVEGDCVIPPAVSPDVLRSYVLGGSPHEGSGIITYVKDATGEEVVHWEKVATENLYSGRLEAWDVHTDSCRYWVMTNPMNIYDHDTFKSLDFTMTVHVGLTTRVRARRQVEAEDYEQRQRLMAAWRRLSQAREALDAADEAEEFQAVGMRCRECLLELVRAISNTVEILEGEERPQQANFQKWTELAANTIASGHRASGVRRYLKHVADAAWPLVNWLTHETNAARFDAEITLTATESVLNAFAMTIVRHERGAPDRCPKCSSYRLTGLYRPDIDRNMPWITACLACNWSDITFRVVDRQGTVLHHQPTDE